MMKGILSVCLLAFSINAGIAQTGNAGFSIVPEKNRKQVNILYNGKLMTAYCYYDSVYKPILYPVNTVDGITVTRGYPIQPRAGERTDHPHHTGMWMNYESVNGLDFWNHSNANDPAEKDKFGTIHHDRIVSTSADKNRAGLTATAQWKNSNGDLLLNETTDFVFTVRGHQFFIDRHTKLTAADRKVVFSDVKDGFLAIRVARELEMPSTETSTYVDAHGKKTEVAPNSKGVTGMYISSNGKEGDSVWSSKGRWTMLTGKLRNEDIAITIFDHPSNPGYPTYWHARGYGLFAANPLGRKIFSKGKEELNLTLQPGESVEFHYLVLVQSGKKGTVEEMNTLSDEFESK